VRLISYHRGASLYAAVALDGERAASLPSVARHAGLDAAMLDTAATMRGFLGLGGDARRAVAAACAGYDGSTMRLAELHLGPPVPDPEKVLCLGVNYRDHAVESGMEIPTSPVVFAKFANSLIGPADPIVIPRASENVDYEAELAVVIGETVRNIESSDAHACLAGAMAFNDVSARDLQFSSSQWMLGKAIDTFGPCGPALVTLDELPDLQALAVRGRVNGETVQDGSTADMIFPVAEVIALLSQVMTLRPGDIVITGTPAGVGMARTPPVRLAPGDLFEVEIPGIGVLANPVIAEAF
jgi:2-keto-4-pentenoate hydratase/2-oxohepta-3-ene-1,7-dioic acid hydratase in catechol pathway